MAGQTLRFDYHRSVAPMLWVFVALASVELLVVHFLLALWWPTLAMAVSLLTLAGIVWLVRAIASFRRLPVLITGETLVMRVGTLRSLSIPFASVAGMRTSWTGDEMNRPGVRNLALIAYPNVWLDLSPPLPARRHPIAAVAHRLDDPAGFTAALATALDAQGPAHDSG